MRLHEDLQKSIEELAAFLKANGLDEQEITHYTLLMEEILLTYRDNPAFDEFELRCVKHSRSVSIKLTVPGKKLNPLEDNLIIERIAEKMENPPVWKYRMGKNTILLKPVLLFSGINSLKYVWSHIQSARGAFAWALFVNMLAIVLGIILPIYAAMLISSLTNSQLDQLLYMSVVVLLLRFLRDAFVFIYESLYAKAHKSMSDSMSADLTEKMLKIRVESIRKHGSGLFIQRLTDDVLGLAEIFYLVLLDSAEIIQFIGILIGFALISPPLFFYEIITIVILTCIETHRANLYQQDERKLRLSKEVYTDAISEIVNANREIKLYRGEKTFLETVRRRNDTFTTQSRQKRSTLLRYKFIRWNLREIFGFIFVILLISFIKEGRFDVTIAVVLFNYNENMYGAVATYGSLMGRIKMFLLSSERLYQLSSSRDYPVERFGNTHIDRLRGEISFEDVTFAYPSGTEGGSGRTILDHMDLHIEPGEYVAITGRSGCGKTTMFNLITKLYETPRGTIRLDGVNIKELDADSIRGNIAIVSQNPHIMHMTIRENFRIVKPDADEEEMIAACKQACIHDDIMAMPDGYDTLIMEDGSNISGGQRQRLAIAMCILKDAPILLMDEATSALDSITQEAVQQNVTRLCGTRTILVVAHRMSTIVNCSRILFMDGGKIVASGTHEQLLRECPAYRELYESDRKHELDMLE